MYTVKVTRLTQCPNDRDAPTSMDSHYSAEGVLQVDPELRPFVTQSRDLGSLMIYGFHYSFSA